ncbi:3'-5' exonuclease domain-containing protein [Hibiscus syriacus]|uniref:3'-5' exonuclease domain-containing protein n=1 Tax=Hibiscus syriacus TaxID=106335 RepID=A0A6A3AKZ6_HIBSY|nr:3'-5' exonuclease domain-containing protein [Hibiscus syriacus]
MASMALRRRTRVLKRYSDDVRCERFGSGDFGSKLFLYDKCDKCFRWFKPRCLIASGFKDRNTKKRKRACGLAMSKRKRKLLADNPTEDAERRPSMAPRSANFAALEKGGMQVLPKEDIETWSVGKRMMEKGECPLIVVFDPVEGFTVQADRYIKDLTIITEYVGDLDYLKNHENDDGDSMMTLLHASSPLKSLVICPDKCGNIARFVNGINNFTAYPKVDKLLYTHDMIVLRFKPFLEGFIGG